MRKTIVFRIARNLCVVLLCVFVSLPALAEAMPSDRLAGALSAGKTLEGTVQLELGEQVAIAGLTLEDVNKALTDTLLRLRLTEIEGQIELGATVEFKGQPVLTADIQARQEEVILTTSLLPGRSFVLPAGGNAGLALPPGTAGLMPSTLLDALAKARQQYGEFIQNWVEEHEGVVKWEENAAQTDPGVQARNTATKTLRLYAAEKDWRLLVCSLLETFARDEALRTALAAPIGVSGEDFAAAARQLLTMLEEPVGVAVDATVSYNDHQEIIDAGAHLDPHVDNLPEGLQPPEGNIAYSRRWSDESHKSDTLSFSLAWGNDGSVKAQFFQGDQRPNPLWPDQVGQEYGGRMQFRDPDGGELTLEASGRIRRAMKGTVETCDHTFDMRLTRNSEPAGGDLFSQLQATTMDAGFILNSQTEAVGEADLKTNGTFELKLMDTIALKSSFTLESHQYAPDEGNGGNAIVRLDTLSPEEQEALATDFQSNFQRFLDVYRQYMD